MAWKRWLPEHEPTIGRALLLGPAAAIVGTISRVVVAPVFGTDLPFITFFPLLLAVSIWGGLGAGLICLGLSCIAAAMLFIPRGDALHLIGAFILSGGLLALAGGALSSTVRELRLSQRRMESAQADLQTLVSELAHRGRNGLAVVMSIVNQSARKANTSQELADILHGRLSALANAQDEVVRGGGDSAPLGSVLKRTLAPFDLDRFIFEASPALYVVPETAAGLALLIHELATNAVKYGALSSPAGQVRLGWNAAANSVRLHWHESGGPVAQEPTDVGFGTRLLKSALASQGGHAERRFAPEGVICEMTFPSAGRVAGS